MKTNILDVILQEFEKNYEKAEKICKLKNVTEYEKKLLFRCLDRMLLLNRLILNSNCYNSDIVLINLDRIEHVQDTYTSIVMKGK